MDNYMKVLILLTMLLSFSGCSSLNARREFAKGAKVYADVILPEYKKYISTDTTLDEDSKKIRERTANEFENYINEYAK